MNWQVYPGALGKNPGAGRPHEAPLADSRLSRDSLSKVMVARGQESKVRRDASAGAPRRRAGRNHDQAPRVKDPEASRTLRAIAYHEAGHVVASHLERLPLRPVTTLPDGEAAGSCAHASILGGRHIEWDTSSDVSRLQMERLVIVARAGEAAQRRFDRRGPRRHQAAADRRQAIDLVSFFTGGPAELDAYLKLLALRTYGLLNTPFVWNQVAAVAEALLAERTIRSGRLERIILTAHEDAVQKLLAPRRTPVEG